MNLIPILVGAFGRKWRRRKNVNLALNNILPSPPPFSVLATGSGGIRAEKEKRGGAKERKRNKIKNVTYDKIEKRDGHSTRTRRGRSGKWRAVVAARSRKK